VLRLTAPPTESASAGASSVQTAPLKTVPALTPGDASAAAAGLSGTRTNTETYKSQPKAFKEPYSEQALRDAQRGGTAAASSPLPPEPIPPSSLHVRIPSPQRAAPVARAIPNLRRSRRMAMKGRLGVAGQSNPDRLLEAASLKGIDRRHVGRAVAAVPAARSSTRAPVCAVRKIIIIKHSGTYLSAYAQQEILVKEGQRVSRGQRSRDGQHRHGSGETPFRVAGKASQSIRFATSPHEPSAGQAPEDGELELPDSRPPRTGGTMRPSLSPTTSGPRRVPSRIAGRRNCRFRSRRPVWARTSSTMSRRSISTKSGSTCCCRRRRSFRSPGRWSPATSSHDNS
jgi:hypothetical protein